MKGLSEERTDVEFDSCSAYLLGASVLLLYLENYRNGVAVWGEKCLKRWDF